jgi:hypothetical protein
MGESTYYTPPGRSPQKSIPTPPLCLLSILNVVGRYDGWLDFQLNKQILQEVTTH